MRSLSARGPLPELLQLVRMPVLQLQQLLLNLLLLRRARRARRERRAWTRGLLLWRPVGSCRPTLLIVLRSCEDLPNITTWGSRLYATTRASSHQHTHAPAQPVSRCSPAGPALPLPSTPSRAPPALVSSPSHGHSARPGSPLPSPPPTILSHRKDVGAALIGWFSAACRSRLRAALGCLPISAARRSRLRAPLGCAPFPAESPQTIIALCPFGCAFPGCAAPGCAAHGCAAPGCADPGCAARGCAAPGCAAPGCAANGCAAPGCAAPSCAAPGCAGLRRTTCLLWICGIECDLGIGLCRLDCGTTGGSVCTCP